jgi:hypothetical protein
MNTAFLLLAQYDGVTIISVELVCRDFFHHLSTQKFIRKADAGEINLPLVRIEGSTKSARGVHLLDLAAYIDARRAEAATELMKVRGAHGTEWKP